MTEPRTFVLRTPAIRERCAAWVRTEAPDDWVIRCRPAAKKREQEEKYHAQIGDIAKQCEHAGRPWDTESWKRLLIDQFADEMRLAGTPLHGDGSVFPSLDGRRIVQLGIQSRGFWVKEACAFIEFLYAFGADRGVVWSDESKRAAKKAEQAVTA